MRDLSSVDQLVRDRLTYPDRDNEIRLALKHDIERSDAAAFQGASLLVQRRGIPESQQGWVSSLCKLVEQAGYKPTNNETSAVRYLVLNNLWQLTIIVKNIVDRDMPPPEPPRDESIENPTYGMF